MLAQKLFSQWQQAVEAACCTTRRAEISQQDLLLPGVGLKSTLKAGSGENDLQRNFITLGVGCYTLPHYC